MSDYSFKVIHEVKKGFPTFQTQQLGALEACPILQLHTLSEIHFIPGEVVGNNCSEVIDFINLINIIQLK